MKGKRYTEEQIIGILKAHEAGAKVADLVRKHGGSDGYEPLRPQQDAELVVRLEAPDQQYPRYGYPLVHGLLRTIPRWSCSGRHGNGFE